MRKRLVRREIPGGVRFITFSCHRRLPLLRHPRIACVFVDCLAEIRARTGLGLYAYVVMPEHVHLLLTPGPGRELAPALAAIKQRVATTAIGRWRELHAPILARVRVSAGFRFWQKGGGFDRNVRDEAEFTKAVQYIHENPVKRGIAARADEYAWSSARWWHRRHVGDVPVAGPGVAPCDQPPGRVHWRAWKGFMVWPSRAGDAGQSA
jgi:putative transposase